MKKKRFKKKRIKALLHRVIPFILVGVITSSAVMMSYEKASEVKAVAGVDDIALIVALMAMAGIAYTGTALAPDYNQDDQDDQESQEERQKLVDDYLRGWYGGVLKQGSEDGWIDPETGEYIGDAATGGGGDGDPDNDDDKDPDKNKFPTWDKLKETVAKCGGRVDLAFASMALPYIVGALGHSILKSAEEGAKNPYGLSDDAKEQLRLIDSNLEDFCMEKKVNLLDYPYELTYIQVFQYGFWIDKYYCKDPLAVVMYGENNKECVYKLPNRQSEYIEIRRRLSTKPLNRYDECNVQLLNTGFSTSLTFDFSKKYYFYTNVPIFTNMEDALAFCNSENPQTVYPDKYVNPSTIGQTSALKDILKETDGKLEKGLHNAAILPTTEQLNKYFEDLKNALNEEEKQEVMDEFVRSLTDPITDPNPNPNPDPDPNPNPNPDPDPDNPGDNTGDDTPKNESFLADLKHLFPFCIPFDLVDCFRLFNAEPVTPRVEVPVHFGIINYDHTFVFDLSDFNGVAVVCRSMFLILYMVGLILATRALIKG